MNVQGLGMLMDLTTSRRSAWLLMGMAVALMTAGCGHKADMPAPPPPDVGVVTIRAQAVELNTELPGRITSYRVAEVRPQVSGVVLKRRFNEGGDVEAGQPLYQIDPAPFQAAYDSSAASLAHAQAAQTSARLLAERYQPLAEATAVSKQDLDNAVAAQKQAEADVIAAKAALETARINLDYTHVTAPIPGRIGRSAVTEGALVTANQTQALAVIQQLDPIYVDVNQPSAVLLRLRRELETGTLKQIGDNQAEVHLILEDGTPYGAAGKLQFTEVTVDQSTGSVTLRAVFPNPKHLLLPGMFARERISEGMAQNALLVPQQGVTHNQRGEPVAWVVGADDTVAQRVLKTERAIGDKWLVSEGIQAGDRVIVEGSQRVQQPGMKVHPSDMPASASSSAPAASAGRARM